MQHRMGTGDLLDSKGRLVERGWATQEVRRYNRAAIKAKAVRIKEWDYYCVLDDSFGIALTVADNGYLGFLGVSWMSVAFRHEPGGRRLTIDSPHFDKGRGLKGELWLEQPPMDRMVIATPFAGAPTAFYYNQKINCMPARGIIDIGGERHIFKPDSAFGGLDWGRGVWTYDNTWYWGSASGLVDGRAFGFNIGYGFGDTSAATENMVFVDGKAHKLAEVTFHMPAGAPDSGPWRFTSSDGRFEMTFEPVVDRADTIDLALFKTVQHQVFGKFSGRVVLDDGAALEITGLMGFAEKVRNRW
jgi:hypothetical protein